MKYDEVTPEKILRGKKEQILKLITCVGFPAFLISAVFVLTGCKQNHQPTAQVLNSTTSSSQPAAKTSFPDVDRKETPRPSIRPPQFKVFKESIGWGVVFIVPVNTTDEQLKSLLWLFRDKVHSRQFSDLGLKLLPDSHESGRGGLFNVYRGVKCANEEYETNSPCGNDPHTAAYFQWGLRQDLNRDAGYIQKKDGSEELIFGYRD